MKSPFEKKFCGKSPIKELTAKQEANLPEALKTAIEAKADSPAKQIDPKIKTEKLPEVDLGVVKSNYKGKVKKLPFPGKEMYERTGDYGRYKGKYTEDMLDMNAKYNYQYNKANDPSYVERKKKQLEFEKNNPNFEDN